MCRCSLVPNPAEHARQDVAALLASLASDEWVLSVVPVLGRSAPLPPRWTTARQLRALSWWVQRWYERTGARPRREAADHCQRLARRVSAELERPGQPTPSVLGWSRHRRYAMWVLYIMGAYSLPSDLCRIIAQMYYTVRLTQ